MTKLLLATIAILTAAPTIAETPLNFERDGITYIGSVAERGGVRYITGHEVKSGRPFSLRVARGWVIGDYAGDDVSFPEPVKAVENH